MAWLFGSGDVQQSCVTKKDKKVWWIPEIEYRSAMWMVYMARVKADPSLNGYIILDGIKAIILSNSGWLEAAGV